MENIKKLIDFDNSNVIFTGHSLGGIISTYLGIFYNRLVITFSAPGEKHFFDLTNFDYNTNSNNIYHFGHDADMITNGNCGNYCWSFGYTMNTQCHIGNSCIYEAKSKLNISESLTSHKLQYIIDNILPKWETDFPTCIYNKKCNETQCNNWIYT